MEVELQNIKTMNRIILFAMVLIAGYLLLAAPLFAAEYKGFVQCDPTKKLTESGSCDLCALLKSIEKIIDTLTTIAFPITIGFVVYGAVVIMIAGGSAEKVTKGRQIITSAVIGLVIVLASWLLINEIMQLILKQGLQPFKTIKC